MICKNILNFFFKFYYNYPQICIEYQTFCGNGCIVFDGNSMHNYEFKRRCLVFFRCRQYFARRFYISNIRFQEKSLEVHTTGEKYIISIYLFRIMLCYLFYFYQVYYRHILAEVHWPQRTLSAATKTV